MSCEAEARKRVIYRVTFVGFVVNLVLTAMKFAAGIAGRSGAMVADAVHSCSDMLTDIVVIAFAKVSAKPRDDGQRTLEQFPEPRTDQVESNLENKDRHDQCCDGIGDAPPLPEEIGTSDARQRPQRRKGVAAVMPGIGDHARAFDPAPFAHRISV